jgi:transketolase
VPCWGEISGKAVRDFVAQHDKVIAVEEHLAAGGFGSFLREGLGNAGDLQARLFCAKLDPSVCGLVGKQETLYAAGGIDPQVLTNVIRQCAH